MLFLILESGKRLEKDLLLYLVFEIVYVKDNFKWKDLPNKDLSVSEKEELLTI